jgi:hypothetical protein
MNTILQEIGAIGFKAGCSALAAGLLGGPVGLVQGGIFGATKHIIGRPVTYLTKMAFGADQPNATRMARFVSFCAATFFSIAATWGLASAVGINMTFSAAIILTATSFGVTVGVSALAIAVLIVTACFFPGLTANILKKIAMNILPDTVKNFLYDQGSKALKNIIEQNDGLKKQLEKHRTKLDVISFFLPIKI